GQGLDAALAAFSAVTRVQVLVNGELTQGVISPGVKGNLGQREALAQLLGGTGLSAAFINADTVTLEKRVVPGTALEVAATTIAA
uniref:STN domain-containing protein n=1 Tax=Vibrio cholerae TaxID=666 RepID=UPI001C1011B9